MSHRILSITAITLLFVITGCLDPDEPGNLVAKTVDQDPSLPRIEVNGTVLHAETFGDPGDPMIIMLHGGPGSDYRGMLPLQALADDGFFVVFWDQRGTGLSRRHDADEITQDLYNEDLRQLIEYYGIRPMVLIGHSWGAMYATMFIDEYGDYGGAIRGAVLSEPGAFTYAQLEDYMADLYGSIDFFGEYLNDLTWTEQFITPAEHERADYFHAIRGGKGLPAENNDPHNPTPSFRAGAVCNAALHNEAERDGFDWTMNLFAFQEPVLFLRGELNEAMPLSHQQELASYYWDAEIITIPGVGHELIWERPADYMAEVRDYFQRIGFEGGNQ